jgi:putative ABC transport system permease protein
MNISLKRPNVLCGSLTEGEFNNLNPDGEMYKIYFKQAIQMLKQHTFIGIISILGTALAIMMIMTLIVSDEVKTLDMAPEINRGRSLYITYQVKRDTIQGSMQSGNVTTETVKEYISKFKTPEYTSFMSIYDPNNRTTVNVEGVSDYRLYSIRNVDASFWKIFSFDFQEGNAFSEEEFKSGIPDAVLSESVAKELFKGEKALGKTIQIAFNSYTDYSRSAGGGKKVCHRQSSHDTVPEGSRKPKK